MRLKERDRQTEKWTCVCVCVRRYIDARYTLSVFVARSLARSFAHSLTLQYCCAYVCLFCLCRAVTVRWQKHSYDVDVDVDQPPLMFKMQLFSLTAVPPERQKIMVKGGMLKDDAVWSSTNIKEGSKLMMMGTADVLVAPTEAIKFVEDLPEEQQHHAVMKEEYGGTGLVNLGNTCYMNATLQCLKAVPELRTALDEYASDGGTAPSSSLGMQTMGSSMLTKELGKLYGALDKSMEPVPPTAFLVKLREKFPQFAQTGQGGMFMQQDAEECWTNIMYSLRECLDGASGSASAPGVNADARAKKLGEIFGIGLETTLESTETDEKSTETSEAYTLKCNITSDINYVHEGLKLALLEDREKRSAEVNRDVLFKGKSQISRLPNYLTVQMVRFFYKQDKQQKAKILRPVAFPLTLDAYDLCTESLRGSLDEPRKIEQEISDAEAGLKKSLKEKEAAGGTDAAADASASANAAANETGADAVMEDAQEVEGASSPAPSQLTGNYELVAVLTHKGRSADSGHYVAWVKNDKGKWIEFDDETPKPRREEDIMTLKGGGDWHMAYMCLYKAKKV